MNKRKLRKLACFTGIVTDMMDLGKNNITLFSYFTYEMFTGPILILGTAIYYGVCVNKYYVQILAQ